MRFDGGRREKKSCTIKLNVRVEEGLFLSRSFIAVIAASLTGDVCVLIRGRQSVCEDHQHGAEVVGSTCRCLPVQPSGGRSAPQKR